MEIRLTVLFFAAPHIAHFLKLSDCGGLARDLLGRFPFLPIGIMDVKIADIPSPLIGQPMEVDGGVAVRGRPLRGEIILR